MEKERLNLLIDRAAIERARRYSRLHRTSISRLVSEFLSRLPVEEESGHAVLTPIVRRVLGIAACVVDGDVLQHYLRSRAEHHHPPR
jgi:hypothetical protein